MSRSAQVLVLGIAAALAACVPSWWPRPAPMAGRASVVLVATGTAFARPGLVERLRGALETATGRPVVRAVDEPPAPPTAALVRRLAREDRRLAAYDAREPGCAREDDVRLVLAWGADAVARVHLDFEAVTRAADPAETPGAMGRVLGPLGIAASGSVLVERLSGTIVLVPMGAARRPEPVRVERRERHPSPGPLSRRLDVEGVLATAVAGLAPPPAPAWDVEARRLVRAGCPLLGLALAEARGTDPDALRAVRAAAVAEMRGRLARVAARGLARDTETRVRAALRAGDAAAAAAAMEAYREHPARDPRVAAALERDIAEARSRAAAAADAARAREERYSCATLCGLHMIELCNNDRALWSQHRQTWETTPCGARRPEGFLQECYRQQWLTGTFHQSCVAPCERAPEGRARLLHILQGAGCVRAAAG